MKFMFAKPDVEKLRAFFKRKAEAEANKKGGFRISASTGLFYIAHDEQLSTAVKKIGYALTRGVSSIDIAGDNFNEVNLTEGQEIRYICEKQGIYLTMHGSLQVPCDIPDRTQWREAQEHINGSIKSAVYAGAKLVNFHSSLNIWLELIQYAGRRLEVLMCDWFGRNISYIMKGNKKMAEWVGTMNPETSKLIPFIWRPTESTVEQWREEIAKFDLIDEVERDPAKTAKFRDIIINELPPELKRELLKGDLKQIADAIYRLDRGVTLRNILIKVLNQDYFDRRSRDLLYRRWLDTVKKKIVDPKYDWEIDKSEGQMRESDFDLIMRILANYLWLMQDPVWKGFLEIEDTKNILRKYGYDFVNPTANLGWLDESLKKASDNGDFNFKLLYYGVVAAKLLEGHILEAFRWMEDEKNGLPAEIRGELDTYLRDSSGNLDEKKYKEAEEELMKNIKELAIATENPDARDPSQAGKYMLWKPEHIYIALRETRRELERRGSHYKDMVHHVFDFEQLATQGVDPLIEMKRATKTFPDMGKWTKMCHSNYPTPLHSHKPIDKADREPIYRCLWELRVTGMGKEQEAIILFERGGGQDPFKGSIAALRAIVTNLEKDVHPDKLPMTFYSIAEGTTDDYPIQKTIIWEHRFDPLAGTLKVPEETYTLLGTAAIKEGKQPKEWKKAEFE